jgi:hypothetical protein
MRSGLGNTARNIICPGVLFTVTGWTRNNAEAADAPAVRDAALLFVNEVRTMGVSPPAWDGATLGDVKAVDTPAGRWHLGYLGVGDRQCGYVLLYEKNGAYLPAMYSGVEPSMSVIQRLGSPSKLLHPPQLKNTQIAQDLLMIASMPQTSEDQPVVITSTGAAAASVLLYLHTVRGYPLFDIVAAMNPRTFGLFARPRPVSGDLSGFSDDEIRKARDAGEATWRSYLKDVEKTLKDNGLDRKAAGPSKRDRTERIEGRSREFAVTASLRKDLLLSSITPELRERLIKDEQMRAEAAVGDTEPTVGRCSARLFAGAYLVSEGELSKAMEAFMKSRGFQVKCERKPARAVVEQDLPFLVAPSAGDALVLVGMTRLENQGMWSAVVIPDTVKAIRMTMGEESQRMRAATASRPAFGRKAARSQPSASQPARSPRQIALDKVIVSHDPAVFLPDSLDRGVHFVVSDCLSDDQWQAIAMSTPVLNDKWGGVRPVFNRQEYRHD